MIDREELARTIFERKCHKAGLTKITWDTVNPEDDVWRRDCLRDADAEIARYAAMGLAIVPIQATERMIDAGMMADGWDGAPERIYAAMLKAAGERG